MAATIGDDDRSWILELEKALLDDCDARTVRQICKGKTLPLNVRAEVWEACLDPTPGKNAFNNFDEIYDLEEQALIRHDCKLVVDELGNDEEDKVSIICDLESILTFHCKSEKKKYESDNGWIHLLEPLLALKVHKCDVYKLFHAILAKYIPGDCRKNGRPFHLFRLLLLYHDPELCSFLDTKKITPDLYSLSWFQTLFAAPCSLDVTNAIWDIYFQFEDPFLLFFLALVILVNAKDQVMLMKSESNAKILETLANVPSALSPDDVFDFCSIAQIYASKTPQSFRRLFATIYDSYNEEMEGNVNVSQALCLPVSVQELIQSYNCNRWLDQSEAVRFFLVDCRPAEQYNAGHLPTAFHLDCCLMLQEPSEFNTAVQALLTAQTQSLEANSTAGGEHLCFMGSGREKEDQYVHMVVASFLQRHSKYVSLTLGGYNGLHEALSDDLNAGFREHDVKRCIACSPDSAATTPDDLSNDGDTIPKSDSFIGKLGFAMRHKSAEMKDKLYDYIVNPAGATSMERHVSSSDKVGKRYRNTASVFSIGDEHEEDVFYTDSDDEIRDTVSIDTWVKKPDVVGSFKCQEVKENGYTFECHLLITKTHLYVLRSIPEKKGMANITIRRPLSQIVKITSRRRQPELITFKYGTPSSDGDSFIVTDMDRFLIPRPGDATSLVKKQILNLTGDGS